MALVTPFESQYFMQDDYPNYGIQQFATEESDPTDQITPRMVPGSLLELKGLSEVAKHRSTSDNVSHNDDKQTSSIYIITENIDGVAQSTCEGIISELASDTGNYGSTNVLAPSETLNINNEPPENASTQENVTQSETPTQSGLNAMPSVFTLKQWVVDKLGIPVAWIDIFPDSGTAIVRFKTPNSAEQALEKLKASYHDGRVMYAGCELTGRILTGMEELNHWKNVLEARQSKLRKRTHKEDCQNFGIQQHAVSELDPTDQVASRMIPGSLLELKGLPEVDKYRSASGETQTSTGVENTENEIAQSAPLDMTSGTGNSGDFGSMNEQQPSETSISNIDPPENSSTQANVLQNDSQSETPTHSGLNVGHAKPSVITLKHWIVDKAGMTIAWIDVFPASGTAIVRFKFPCSAEQAWDNLKASYPDGRVMYAGCELTGRVLTGTEELTHWKKVFDAEKSKMRKRRIKNKRRRMF